MKNLKRYRYSIFHDGHDWVATSSEFKNLSGLGSTPKEALRHCMAVIASAREIVNEDNHNAMKDGIDE